MVGREAIPPRHSSQLQTLTVARHREVSPDLLYAAKEDGRDDLQGKRLRLSLSSGDRTRVCSKPVCDAQNQLLHK